MLGALDESGIVSRVELDAATSSASVFTVMTQEMSTTLSTDELNEEQMRSCGIVSSHLDDLIANKAPPPLRLIIYGQGGTGRSKVIQTLTAKFESVGCRGLLIKSSYTGASCTI